MKWLQWLISLSAVFVEATQVWSGCTSEPACRNCTYSKFSCDNVNFGPILSTSLFPKENYHSLMFLKIKHSGIKYIDTGVFDIMQNLQVLNLSHNSINEINGQLFSNLTLLTSLDLSCNKITSIDENSFKNLLNLQNLDLSQNQLSSLGNGPLFSKVEALRFLDISQNHLVTLSHKTFLSQRNLSTLNLGHNRIFRIPVSVLRPLENLQNLSLKGNAIICDCDFHETLFWCDEHGVELKIFCRNESYGDKVPLDIVRKYNCSEISSSENKENTCWGMITSGVAIGLSFAVSIVFAFLYFKTKRLKRRRSLCFLRNQDSDHIQICSNAPMSSATSNRLRLSSSSNYIDDGTYDDSVNNYSVIGKSTVSYNDDGYMVPINQAGIKAHLNQIGLHMYPEIPPELPIRASPVKVNEEGIYLPMDKKKTFNGTESVL